MTPETLKAWRARLSLGEAGMAAYLGVPVTTYRKWENGTRKQDASTLRLFEVLQAVEREALNLHLTYIGDAQETPEKRPAGARKGRGRGKGATVVENVSAVHSAPPPWQHAADALPAWMIQGAAPCP